MREVRVDELFEADLVIDDRLPEAPTGKRALSNQDARFVDLVDAVLC